MEAISEILVADTDLESGAQVSDVEDEFEEEKEDKTQAAKSGRLPTWGPCQGRNTNMHPFVRPAKGVKRSEAPYINKYSSPRSVLLFFTEIFHLLVEQINIYYQQHLDGQAGPSCQLPDITLLDMMIFTALVLQMVHERHYMTTSQDYSYTLRFWRDHDKRQIFTHTSFSAFCRQFTETWQRQRIWPTMETKDCVWHTEWGGLC